MRALLLQVFYSVRSERMLMDGELLRAINGYQDSLSTKLALQLAS